MLAWLALFLSWGSLGLETATVVVSQTEGNCSEGWGRGWRDGGQEEQEVNGLPRGGSLALAGGNRATGGRPHDHTPVLRACVHFCACCCAISAPIVLNREKTCLLEKAAVMAEHRKGRKMGAEIKDSMRVCTSSFANKVRLCIRVCLCIKVLVFAT